MNTNKLISLRVVSCIQNKGKETYLANVPQLVPALAHPLLAGGINPILHLSEPRLHVLAVAERAALAPQQQLVEQLRTGTAATSEPSVQRPTWELACPSAVCVCVTSSQATCTCAPLAQCLFTLAFKPVCCPGFCNDLRHGNRLTLNMPTCLTNLAGTSPMPA